MDKLLRDGINVAILPNLTKMVSLDFEQAGFHGGGAAQPPQQAGQPQHQFPLYGRLGVVIGSDGCFEGFVVFGIFQCSDYRLGRKAMADGIAARALLAFLRRRPGTLGSIAAVGGDLPERGHREAAG